jgi:hypothetical protein
MDHSVSDPDAAFFLMVFDVFFLTEHMYRSSTTDYTVENRNKHTL